jgi:hypothetical protein
MEFVTRELRLTKETLVAMTSVAASAFGGAYSQEQIEKNWTLSHPDSVFFGAFQGESLVSFVGFLAHSARAESEGLTRSMKLFQACHVSTRADFKGRGLFPRIVAHALSHLDGDYIIGFPNAVAQPIWLNKFHFNLTRLRRIWVNLLAPQLHFDPRKLTRRDLSATLIRADENAIAAWKSLEHEGEVIRVETAGNLIWGRISEKPVGVMTIKFFVVGGASIENPDRLCDALVELRRATRTAFARFICTDTSPLCSAATFSLPGDNTEPLIWAPLGDAPKRVDFDISNGIKDVA